MLTSIEIFTYLSVITGFIGGVVDTDDSSPSSATSSSLEAWISSDSSSPSPFFDFFVLGLVGISTSLP